MTETTELTVPQRAAVALGAAEHEKNLLALATKYADITKIVNPAGREQCHSAYMELKNTRVAIVNAGKSAREDANAFQTAVISEVNRLTAITVKEEARLQTLRDEYDAEREREKAAKAEAEKARVDGIRKKIADLQAMPAMAVGWKSKALATGIETLEAVAITLEEYAEFSSEAEMVKVAAIQKIGELLTAQLEVEAEQARIAAEREALAKERAEAAERDRIAAAARSAEEAKARALREAEEAKARAEREAEQRQLDAQRAEIERQQAELAAERQRQTDEAARIEREKQEAIAAEAARVAAEERRQQEAKQAAERAEALEAAEALAAIEAERQRRERVQFEMNGPGDVEIVGVLTDEYSVSADVVIGWLSRFDRATIDDKIALLQAA